MAEYAGQPEKKPWELEAEKMLRSSLIRKGRIVTYATKAKYVRRAYLRLMKLHEQTYWSMSEKPEHGHQSRRIRQARRIIRHRLSEQAREMMKPAVTLQEHKQVIAGLEEQIEAKRRAILEDFKKQQAEAAELRRQEEERVLESRRKAEEARRALIADPLERELDRLKCIARENDERRQAEREQEKARWKVTRLDRDPYEDVVEIRKLKAQVRRAEKPPAPREKKRAQKIVKTLVRRKRNGAATA